MVDDTTFENVPSQRTRLKESRAASTRSATSHNLDAYRRMFEQKLQGATYIPEDILPEGYVYQWVIYYTGGRVDSANLNRYRQQGWELVQADDIPQLASLDNKGNNRDDTGLITLNELVLLRRPKEVNDIYIDVQKQSVAFNAASSKVKKTLEDAPHIETYENNNNLV